MPRLRLIERARHGSERSQGYHSAVRHRCGRAVRRRLTCAHYASPNRLDGSHVRHRRRRKLSCRDRHYILCDGPRVDERVTGDYRHAASDATVRVDNGAQVSIADNVVIDSRDRGDIH